MSMDTQKIADIRKVELSVAANIDTVAPKRNATTVNNAQREAVVSQAKASERAQNAIVGSQDGNPAVQALNVIGERLAQMLMEAASPGFKPSAGNSLARHMELSRLTVMAKSNVMVAQARQQLHEQVMRAILLGS